MTSSAVIWSGALQASATLLAREFSARWGIDQPGTADAAWPPSQPRRFVELAAHIVMEMSDDPEAGISEAKEAAQRWLEGRGR